MLSKMLSADALSMVASFSLLRDLTDDTGTNGAAAFTNSKTQAFFHRDWCDQSYVHFDVITWHNHFST
eukprot:m.297365 g.297365  ORF g.297365 m.297365 type:complete len:68 (+) comp301613_c0_seq1:1-204(+)